MKCFLSYASVSFSFVLATKVTLFSYTIMKLSV